MKGEIYYYKMEDSEFWAEFFIISIISLNKFCYIDVIMLVVFKRIKICIIFVKLWLLLKQKYDFFRFVTI